MRLYIKLFTLLLAAASLQHLVLSDSPPSEIWFGIRCSLAYTLRDKQMINRLADEARSIEFAHELRVSASR